MKIPVRTYYEQKKQLKEIDNLKNINDYRKLRELYILIADFTEGDSSLIWTRLRKDFQSPRKVHLRGYGLSRFTDAKIKIYKFLTFPFKKLLTITNLSVKVVLRVISWVVLDFDYLASKKYGLDLYQMEWYDHSLVKNFQEKYSKQGIGFSHNTLKSYSYLERLMYYSPLGRSLNIFEVGAGVFNFGHLLSLQLYSFNYIVCDLEEMIVTSHKEITETYIPHCNGNYDVFLPNEIDKFFDSESLRKILFITSKQFHSGILTDQLKFDLFVNHESFAEMNITTVNKYLGVVAKIMKTGGIVNIVNRHSRAQAISKDDFVTLNFNNLTNFSDYDLSFCTTEIVDIDKFRSRIPLQREMPNIFYIGKVIN